ncbi:DUF6051 family protein, partial [Marinilabilia sp.]|uniref:DUF6051 family protein n=1 Tax=Marinilabilia sp. TaxID=2021252 RepID=UPI0025C3410B
MGLLFELQKTLFSRFDLSKPFGQIDRDVVFYTYPFESNYEGSRFHLSAPDSVLAEDLGDGLLASENYFNRLFRYAIFEPVKRKENANAIVLLHGLNERKWGKYLLWAYKLAEWTGAPVILFPLANHMNRSPEAWSYPRKMSEVLRKRRDSYGAIENSSFANVALSSRVDRSPEVFISSGLQSILDIVELTAKIRSGIHPLFKAGTGVDFFSYSIGALVTEILLMANPSGLFSTSKAFLFCGGATFDQMDARSRTILDNKAFESLQGFVRSFELVRSSNSLFELFKPFGNSIREVFLSMISLENFRPEREYKLKSLANRVRALGLKLDKVIPGRAILDTFCMGQCKNVAVADFDFKYSHEMPFPINDVSVADKVEQAFQSVFRDASCFLKR